MTQVADLTAELLHQAGEHHSTAIPPQRLGLTALTDSAVLLTVALR